MKINKIKEMSSPELEKELGELKTELLVQLKNYSKESGVPISRLLDKSIELFLDKIKTAN